MKNIFSLIIYIIIFLTQNAFTQVADKIIAVVDKEIITESDLRYATQMVAMQNRIDPSTPGLANKVLDNLINEKLFLAQSYEDSILVSDDDVNDRLERQIKLLIQQYGSEKDLEQIYGMPISKMKREYQDEIRKQLLIQKMKQSKESTVTISVREVEDFYKTYKDSLPIIPTEYHLNHIFIKPKPTPSREAITLQKINKLIDSLKMGVPFAELAGRHSTDPGSATHEGDLGFVKRGTFVKEFEEAVYTMKVGQISKPIKTQFGYHIIKLLERNGDLVRPQHILLPIEITPEDDDSTIAFLNRIKERVLKGESFASLAKQYSEDPETKDVGGDLNVLTLEQMEPSMQEIIKNLKKGDVSEPNKLSVGPTYGYQIIFVRSLITEHAVNLKDDYRKIENLALQLKTQKKNQEWIDEMRKNIYWEKKI